MIRLPKLLIALALPAAALAQTPSLPADQAAIRAHVAYLASDEMKGREAGSPDYDRAAAYVADQFRAAGLQPAGDAGGYLQRVPLVTYRLAAGASASLVAADGAVTRLAAPDDWTASANPAAARTAVAAPVVFVGYGIVAPAYGRDDYAGVDVRGRIVAFVGGAPADLSSEERAFFRSAGTKAMLAAKRGAIGAIELSTLARPAAAARPDRGRTTWMDGAAGFSDNAAAPLLGTLSASGGARLFAGAPVAWSTIVEEAAKPVARFRAAALPATLRVESATDFAPFPSANVVGLLPGRDPALRGETVVLSAHLDHIGERPARPDDKPGTDRINNGALDDAIGIASLIEEAKRFTRGRVPRRSILFLAVTAEEKGLVGSSYFAHRPTAAAGRIVADINLDMPILTYRFEDLVAFGGDRSTLGPVIARAAAKAGVTMAPDPIPEQGIFVRSDHFNFVRQGVPSIFLWPGPKAGGLAATEHFMATCYHRPCDDMTQPILWDQAVRFVDVNYRIARDIADAKQRPVWNREDIFGMLFGGPMAE